MVSAKILLNSVLLLLMLLTGCTYEGSGSSEAPNVSVPPPTASSEATPEAQVPANPIEFDMSTIDRVVFIQNREKQTAWETADVELVSQFVDAVAGFKYGPPQQGGYAGEFLYVKIYEGDTELGDMHFATSNQIQQVANDLTYLYPIKAGSWSDAEWEDFLGKCIKKP